MDQQKHTTEDTLTDIFGSKEMRSPAPTEFIPKNKTAPVSYTHLTLPTNEQQC